MAPSADPCPGTRGQTAAVRYPPSYSAIPARADDDGLERAGSAALRQWLDELCRDYASDVRWGAPRRGVHRTGRREVLAGLHAEQRAMAEPRLCVLRHTTGQPQRFHEFTIRFRLVAPGIEGVDLPIGTEVELERLRICTCDDMGRIVVEACIETWTQLDSRDRGSPCRPGR